MDERKLNAYKHLWKTLVEFECEYLDTTNYKILVDTYGEKATKDMIVNIKLKERFDCIDKYILKKIDEDGYDHELYSRTTIVPDEKQNLLYIKSPFDDSDYISVTNEWSY